VQIPADTQDISLGIGVKITQEAWKSRTPRLITKHKRGRQLTVETKHNLRPALAVVGGGVKCDGEGECHTLGIAGTEQG
jgi:hypothetical protein